MTTVAVKTNSKSGMSPLTLVYSGMFAALMMIGANITAFLPFLVVGGVPITLQTFFAILAGLILGSRRGALAMTVYMFIGLAGAPVFAKIRRRFWRRLSVRHLDLSSLLFSLHSLPEKLLRRTGSFMDILSRHLLECL